MPPMQPISPFIPTPDIMAWERVVSLFRRHGLEPPPVRLRDELVGHLVWAEHGWACAAERGGDDEVA